MNSTVKGINNQNSHCEEVVMIASTNWMSNSLSTPYLYCWGEGWLSGMGSYLCVRLSTLNSIASHPDCKARAGGVYVNTKSYTTSYLALICADQFIHFFHLLFGFKILYCIFVAINQLCCYESLHCNPLFSALGLLLEGWGACAYERWPRGYPPQKKGIYILGGRKVVIR